MRLLKNKTHIHGFEDYNILPLYDGCLVNSYEFRTPYYFDNSAGTYIINKDLPVKVCNVTTLKGWFDVVNFNPCLCEDHRELLATANKVFTHPSCKLSRSMLAEKYKKSLNPWLSDAVVVPKFNPNELCMRRRALFIHEQGKIILLITLNNPDAIKMMDGFSIGTKFKDCAQGRPDTSSYNTSSYDVNCIMDAELFYVGEVLYIPNTQSYILDILTQSIPVDKTVFESTIQESLGNETNRLDFDSLTSIKDMLESSDEDTVAAGLKSLSMMDWMHYPNSIKFIMTEANTSKWKYNKACDSTSVKYMLKTISKSSRRTWWPGRMEDEIYEQDYELFKQLKMHYEHILPENIMESLRFNAFMTVSNGILCPRLKEKDI